MHRVLEMLLDSPNPHFYSNSPHQWFSNDNDFCLPGWSVLAGIWGHKTQGNAEQWSQGYCQASHCVQHSMPKQSQIQFEMSMLQGMVAEAGRVL